VYAPTLALVNSIVFAHVDASLFPWIRVWGSVGWIVVGLSLKLFLKPGESVNNRPLLLAAALSAVLGVFCFFLPDTAPKGGEAFPFRDAFELLRDPSFGVFFGVSFLISLALSVYFSFTALFLEQHGKVSPDNIGPIMTIGQWVEVLFMVLLPWFLSVLGMKWVLAVGALSWGVRYGLFAVGRPLLLLILGIALHGVCFNFFFTAGAMYVEEAAPPAISASAQSLFVLVTYGIGMTIGAVASGWLNELLTKEVTDPETGAVVKATDWRTFWLVPCGIVMVSFVLLLIFLRV
jgi:nucleoside transporter